MLIQGRNVVDRCASVNDLRTKRFYNSAYISLRNWRDFTVPPNENPNDAEAFTHSVIRKTENETGAVNSVSGFCCIAWLPFFPVRVYACWLAVVMTPMRDLLLERERHVRVESGEKNSSSCRTSSCNGGGTYARSSWTFRRQTVTYDRR